MSFDTSVWVRHQQVGNGTAKHVLRVLADHAGQDHSCYLRISLIAREAEIGESTVRAALARLIESGFIRVFDRYDENGRRRSNRYQILIDGPDTPEPDAEDWADVRQQPEGDRQEPEGGALDTGASTRQEPEGIPYTEPTKKEPTSVKGRAAREQLSTRIPNDFQPTDEMRAWFVREQLGSVIDGVREHEKFTDYWRAMPGMRGRKVDWAATWRLWMRQAAERAGGRRPGNGVATYGQSGAGRSTTDDRVSQALALAAKYEEQGE